MEEHISLMDSQYKFILSETMRGTLISFWIVLIVAPNCYLAAYCKFTNVVCDTFNKTWVTIEHCRLRAIRRDKTVLNINATFHYPGKKVHLKYQILKKANGYKPWIIDGTIDGCAFMIKRNHPFVKMIYGFIKDSVSINHPCPYVGQQWIKDFYLKAEQMPLPWPTGDYALLLTWIFSDLPTFTTNIYFTFMEDLLKQ